MADFYGKMYDDFNQLQNRYGMGGQPKGLIPGFTNADLAGFGTQIAGGILGDIQNAELRREEMREAKRRENLGLIMGARDFRRGSEADVVTEQNTQRGQNQNAFDRMMKSRETARQNAGKYSFRRSMLRGLGG